MKENQWLYFCGVFFLGAGTALACEHLVAAEREDEKNKKLKINKLVAELDVYGLNEKNLDNVTEYENEILVSRKTEIVKLIHFVRSIGTLSQKLVLHRGFHLFDGRYDARPLENTQPAYEIAWACGIVHCECDIQVSQDDCIVLNHDLTLERFTSLNKQIEDLIPPSSILKTLHDFQELDYNKPVEQLSFLELLKLPLINGARTPLLSEVLECANLISSKIMKKNEFEKPILSRNSKLVIEIKQQNAKNIENYLPSLFEKCPSYLDHVSCFMSFSETLLARLKEKMPKCDVPFILLLNSPVVYHSSWELTEADAVWSPSWKNAEQKFYEMFISQFGFSGAYLEFEPGMIQNEKQKSVMKNICEKYCMGVWSAIPLSLNDLYDLEDLGFQLINTDLEFWDNQSIGPDFFVRSQNVQTANSLN